MQIFKHEKQGARLSEAREAAEERFEQPDALALGVNVRRLRQRRDARADFGKQLRDAREPKTSL